MINAFKSALRVLQSLFCFSIMYDYIDYLVANSDTVLHKRSDQFQDTHGERQGFP